MKINVPFGPGSQEIRFLFVYKEKITAASLDLQTSRLIGNNRLSMVAVLHQTTMKTHL